MGKPIRFWAKTLYSLGRVSCKGKRPAAKTPRYRNLVIECVEPRMPSLWRHAVWDPGHTGPASGPSGGTGTWDTANSYNWFNPASPGGDVQWADGDTAVFANTAGNVIVTGAVDVAVIEFQSGGYLLSPYDVNASLAAEPTGTEIDVAADCAATIAALFTGSGGLIVDGAGALTLAGANTYAGGTEVTAGVLDFAVAAACAGRRGPDRSRRAGAGRPGRALLRCRQQRHLGDGNLGVRRQRRPGRPVDRRL